MPGAGVRWSPLPPNQLSVLDLVGIPTRVLQRTDWRDGNQNQNQNPNLLERAGQCFRFSFWGVIGPRGVSPRVSGVAGEIFP